MIHTKRTIRVLVVDDSPLAREMIISFLAADGNIIVVGEAKNGCEAIEKTAQLRPDLVTMDIEMPLMDGLEAIERIMMSTPVPILVVTSRGDAATAYSALSRGALEVVEKPDIDGHNGRELVKKVRVLSGVRVITHINAGKRFVADEAIAAHLPVKEETRPGIVAIASSTGGPQALSHIFSHLPANYPVPIVVAQHISDGFACGMAEWLNSKSPLEIALPEQGAPLLPGRVYIASSEHKTVIDSQKRIQLSERPGNEIYRPSCNTLLSSAAGAFGPCCVGVILTGMGDDGVEGMRLIKAAGGVTLAQDAESSVVFGMNRFAVERGYCDRVVPLADIPAELLLLARGSGK